MNTHDIELPAEFRSGNDIPVTQATIKRERMEEILRDAIEADRQRGNAKQRYDEIMKDDTEEPDPIEDLRFYCSMAMSGQDWLDVEPFFDRLIADRKRRGEPVNEEELLAAREALIDMGYLWDGDQWVEVDPPSKTAEQDPEWPDFARMEASLQRLKERLVFENSRRNDLEQKLREKRNG